MGVQQIIANNDNILIGAGVEATSVTPSAEISRTAITRAGTGLVELSGLYTGHASADYDIEIVTGEGNGRASAPVFSGVGSGSIAVTAADIPAQDVTITLLTPPYPGAIAEARIGADIVKATAVGTGGNLISITVDRSGLTFTESGSSTLEAIAEGTDELTNYKWDIPGVVCSTDLKGNVPADAPRVRLGSDPTIYRIIKDSRSGTLKTILSPAAVRPIPTGAKIWTVTGTYAVTVTDGTDTETYTGLITGYDLLYALMISEIVQPAYTPAPVTTAGGNASVDLPLVTGSTALLTDSSSAGVRPDNITARTTANADTIRMQSKGNGAWSVTSPAGTAYPDAFEGQVYAPASSPVLLTIPARPQPATASSTQPVYLAAQEFVAREDAEAALPLLCIEGALGINAVPKTITATYRKRPEAADCPCPTDHPYFSEACLGLKNSVLGEDSMALDPAYQTRLVALYEWEKGALGYDASLTYGSYQNGSYSSAEYYLVYGWDGSDWESVGNIGSNVTAWDFNNQDYNLLETIESSSIPSGYDSPTWLKTQYPSIQSGQAVAVHYPAQNSTTYTTGLIGILNPRDITFIKKTTEIMADCLAQIWGDTAACTAWDSWTTEVKAEIAALQLGDLPVEAYYQITDKYTAGANAVLATAGIVPGKSDTASGNTGCWQDSDAGFWWLLSDGYAPAFTGKEYISTRAGSFENTMEFGFMIKCGCEDKLLEGDQITIQIGANLAAMVWSSNEFLEITTIPTTPLYLTGGKNPDDSETWSVTAKDSSNAALPVASLDATNRGYSSGGLEFTIAPGGIPFNVGDRFSFTVEGGTFQWRKNAGAWSAATAIADNTLLDSGLYVSFLSGAAPSFMSGDSYSFRADQVSAATSLLIPDNAKWEWPDATASITLTLPTPSTLSTLALLHSLPAGAAIAVDYWDADTATMIPLPWASGVVRDYLHITTGASITTTAIRITVDAPGSIRWLWAGVPFQPTFSAALRLRKQYDMVRAKAAGSAVLLGEGTGASIAWDFLSLDDADKLLNLMRCVKVHGDQPVILIPQHLHPEEWALSRLADDGIEITDLMEYQPDDINHRILSGTMELTPEWR